MPANAHTSKKFTRMCFEKSEVTSAQKQIKMVVSKHLNSTRVWFEFSSEMPG